MNTWSRFFSSKVSRAFSIFVNTTSTFRPVVFRAIVLLSSGLITHICCKMDDNVLCDNVPLTGPLDFTVRLSYGSSAGSGFVISEDGYIVTNAHVVSNSNRGNVQVLFSDGSKYSGKIHSCDTVSDLALIKIEPTGDVPFAVAKLGNSKDVQAGDAITAVGAPLHLQNTISQGIVSAPLRHEYEISLPTNYEAFIQTDISTNPGSSGGPLLNQRGEVIGVHCRKHAGGWGLAIPVDRVKEVVRQLRESRSVVRPHYGLGMADQVRGRAAHSVVVVTNVARGSPAQACGIQKNDCIIAVNGNKVRRIKDVLDVLYENGLQVGTAVEFTLLREFELDPVRVRLVTAPKPVLQLHSLALTIPTNTKKQ